VINQRKLYHEKIVQILGPGTIKILSISCDDVMKITILAENNPAPSNSTLIHEHGLSLHINFQGNKILFDTGVTDAFAKNAANLGIDLAAVDLAVISHHHYDHGGGLADFMVMNQKAKIYLKRAPQGEEYYKAFGFKNRYIGLEPGLLDNHSNRVVFVDHDIEIFPGLFLLPNIEITYPKPKGNRYMYLKQGSTWQRDEVSHELLMVIKNQDDLVIISGCSHNGVLNMVATASKKFAGVPIKALIGGFHLVGLPMFNTMAGSKRQIAEIGRKMLRYPIEKVYAGHCTGQKAYHVLNGVMGEQIDQLHTGMEISL